MFERRKLGVVNYSLSVEQDEHLQGWLVCVCVCLFPTKHMLNLHSLVSNSKLVGQRNWIHKMKVKLWYG